MPEQWRNDLEGVLSASTCAQHGLIQFKVKLKSQECFQMLTPLVADAASLLLRWHTLSGIVLICSISGVQSSKQCQTFSKRWFSRTLVGYFWCNGRRTRICLELNHKVLLCYVLEQRLVLLHWKSPHPPSWLRDVMQHLKLEKLRLVAPLITLREYGKDLWDILKLNSGPMLSWI